MASNSRFTNTECFNKYKLLIYFENSKENQQENNNILNTYNFTTLSETNCKFKTAGKDDKRTNVCGVFPKFFLSPCGMPQVRVTITFSNQAPKSKLIGQ